ncbi:hypothetical protein IX307_001609 [Bacteroides pyogenes]|uniref:DUF4974 domain-containing protein n=3 Tax=Bacteroides pyogenes TaxID=310300 RepID=A0A5D3EB80_9BACE|nr:FecR domain-containing protein [Bacteroides pyogenes]GAE15672.1 putative anti-sigma factor [Bacteroides pyogenes JCM 6292]MBR8705838.1 hypothetical protein [Bacteroides pyogenes]MBR8709714.1 hypothetical protein [Bacteroides pyogenes]MBR8718596.1 hypothetical protein [Bacteroides pyogenes]MBR8721433.1 hypothetical protein [Bacteroides pyogenes]
MSELEEKCIRFVLMNYKHGVFDTRKAFHEWKNKNSIHTRKRHIGYYWSGVAASLLLCIGTYLYWNMHEDDAWMRIAATDNIMEYMLPDSTFVTLSPHSTLKYRSEVFRKEQREVEMTGKAYFRVYRDAVHPFCVTGQYAVVKVLGTKFQIDETLSDSATEVYVSSGKVLFAAKGENDGMVLTKNMQASLMHGAHHPHIVASQTPNPVAWAVGKFVYEKTTLSDVLEELSNYYHVKLTTSNAEKTLSAEFETGDGLDVIVSLIEESLEVKIEKE